MPHGERPRAAEQAPRPARVLSLELVGGAGAILDAARRAVGVAPDGSLRNAIPGAHVERDGNIVRLVIPNPTRAMHFVPGRGLTDVRYSILDARGRVVASGEAAPKSGTLPEAFDRLAGAVPDATPSPSPVRLRPPLPTPSHPCRLERRRRVPPPRRLRCRLRPRRAWCPRARCRRCSHRPFLDPSRNAPVDSLFGCPQDGDRPRSTRAVISRIGLVVMVLAPTVALRTGPFLREEMASRRPK